MWYNGENSKDGEMISELLSKINLRCLNRIAKYHAFKTADGKTNVNATLASPGRGIVNERCEWESRQVITE